MPWRRALALVLALAAPASAERAQRFDTVVLDAGHGGDDTGAKGPRNTLEKQVVLDVVGALADRLRARGLRVVLTRRSDEFVPLERRTAIANDARGDLFLSIHANAAEDRAVRGSETYFLALDASDAGAAAVAERENQAFADGDGGGIDVVNDPFIALLGDMIATEHLQESSVFARGVQSRLGANDQLHSRGVKQALFVVLNGVQMPAALVEIGFITNPQDERILASAAGRSRIVDALEKAVLDYGRRYDAQHGAPPAKEGSP
jgi:N-acetylmuramoyl-L-alanine amidase